MTSKVGTKEQQVRDLREKKISRAHQMMIEDGAGFLVRHDTPEEAAGRERTRLELKDGLRRPAVAAPTSPARSTDAATPKETEMSKTTSKKANSTKKTAAKKKAPAKPASAKKPRAAKPANGGEKSKTQIAADLIRREGGCTTKDILKATGWPTVSVPAIAKAAGLTLKKEKVGRETRYTAGA